MNLINVQCKYLLRQVNHCQMSFSASPILVEDVGKRMTALLRTQNETDFEKILKIVQRSAETLH